MNSNEAFAVLLEQLRAAKKQAQEAAHKATDEDRVDDAEAALKRMAQVNEQMKRLEAMQQAWPGVVAGSSELRHGATQPSAQSNRLHRPATYFLPILQLLADGGGEGQRRDVVKRLSLLMADQFTQADLTLLPDGKTPRWSKQAGWAEIGLRQRGLTSRDTPHGVWRITEAGRAYLHQQSIGQPGTERAPQPEDKSTQDVELPKPPAPSTEPQRGRLREITLALSRNSPKAWYHHRDASGSGLFLAFVNAKGSCSVRLFDAATGQFIAKDYDRGGFQQAFAEDLAASTQLQVSHQPNLQTAERRGLPADVLRELQQQIAQASPQDQTQAASVALAGAGAPLSGTAPRKPLARGVALPKAAYYLPTLQAVYDLGGEGRPNDVLERVHAIMQPTLSDVDNEMLADGKTPRWRFNAIWQYKELREMGLLASDAPKGIWRITDNGRTYIQQGGKPSLLAPALDASRLPGRTALPESELWIPILTALGEMGGEGHMHAVVKRVEVLLKGKLRDADYTTLKDGRTARWVNKAWWASHTLKNHGLLAADSPGDMWTITDKGRAWLQEALKKT